MAIRITVAVTATEQAAAEEEVERMIEGNVCVCLYLFSWSVEWATFGHVSETKDYIPIMLSISYCSRCESIVSLSLSLTFTPLCRLIFPYQCCKRPIKMSFYLCVYVRVFVLTMSFCMVANRRRNIYTIYRSTSTENCVSHSYHKTYYTHRVEPLYFMSISAQCCTYPLYCCYRTVQFNFDRLFDWTARKNYYTNIHENVYGNLNFSLFTLCPRFLPFAWTYSVVYFSKSRHQRQSQILCILISPPLFLMCTFFLSTRNLTKFFSTFFYYYNICFIQEKKSWFITKIFLARKLNVFLF